MSNTTKYGLLALLVAVVSALLVTGQTSQELPSMGLEVPDFMVRYEAAISLRLVSLAALITGLVALSYSAYRWLRPVPATAQAAAQSSLPGSMRLRRVPLETEFLIVLGVVALFLLINFASAEIYPMVWVDETGYTDPAINLTRGFGLTSSAWYNAFWGKFWYSFPPLYPLLLSGWIKLFGVNLSVIRLFNIALASGAAIGLWRYALRSQLVTTFWGRIAIVLLPLLSYGASFCYRNSRPDTLEMLLAALALNASIITDRRGRWLALIMVGLLVPWAGPHVSVFAVIVGLLVAVWWLRRALDAFVPLGIGMAVGLLALFGFYLMEGGFYGFLAATFGSVNSITGQIAHALLLHEAGPLGHIARLPLVALAATFEDRSNVFLTIAALVLFIALRRVATPAGRQASGFALTAAFGIPILTMFAGQYWLTYTWTATLAMGIAVVVAIEAAAGAGVSIAVRRLAVGCVAVALLVGLPTQLARAYMERQARDYSALRAFVRAQKIAPGDWVYVTPPAYFAVAELGAIPVTTMYANGRLAPEIPQDQRDRIKLFIVRPPQTRPGVEARADTGDDSNQVGATLARLGGNWKQVGVFTLPKASHLVWPERGQWLDEYDLVAYRRE